MKQPTGYGFLIDKTLKKLQSIYLQAFKEQGIDLADVPGTGPDGKVTEKDILSYTPEADEYDAFNASIHAIVLSYH